MNKTDEFLELYNELDDLLRMKYHENSRSTSVIVRYSNELIRSGVMNLQKIGKKLNTIRMLRNNIIHEYDNNKDNFFEVNDEAINFLKTIVDYLKNPRTAKDLYTSIDKLYSVREDDNLLVLPVMKEMRMRGFSQTPILDKNNVLKGVFSPNVLFEFLVENKEADLNTLTFKDLKKYLPIDAHFSESYIFIPIRMSEDEIDNIFITSYEKNSKLAVAFVTKNGLAREPILGIIVTKDIIKD